MSAPCDPKTSSIRLFSEQPLATGQTITLDRANAKHLITVLRARAGDPVVLFNGDGFHYFATVLAAGAAKACQVKIHSAQRSEAESSLRIHLIQAIGRGERMDYAIQKATELGVSHISPLITSRVGIKLDDQRAAKRRDRWRSIAIGACEQCGRATIPTVDEPQILRNLSWPTGPVYCLDPRATQGLQDLPTTDALTLIVGPEGGFSADEVEALALRGALGVRFGPRILRTETAGPACIAALQVLWGDCG